MSDSSVLANQAFSRSAGDRGRSLRSILLLSTLGALVVALWYDYRVARPAVDTTYDLVMQLNYTVNSSSAKTLLTAQDIRSLINRQPVRIVSHGPFQVEVYSWVAGLPFRSHDYYAVYLGRGRNMRFMRQYKYHLPTDELTPPRARRRRSDAAQGFAEEIEYLDAIQRYSAQPLPE